MLTNVFTYHKTEYVKKQVYEAKYFAYHQQILGLFLEEKEPNVGIRTRVLPHDRIYSTK